jgi:hypothetical protein
MFEAKGMRPVRPAGQLWRQEVLELFQLRSCELAGFYTIDPIKELGVANRSGRRFAISTGQGTLCEAAEGAGQCRSKV